MWLLLLTDEAMVTWRRGQYWALEASQGRELSVLWDHPRVIHSTTGIPGGTSPGGIPEGLHPAKNLKRRYTLGETRENTPKEGPHPDDTLGMIHTLEKHPTKTSWDDILCIHIRMTPLKQTPLSDTPRMTHPSSIP